MFNLWRLNKKFVRANDDKVVGVVSRDSIKKVLGDSNDIIIKDIYTLNDKVSITAIGIDGMVDSNIVDNYILRPLTVGRPFLTVDNEKDAYEIAKEGFLYHFSQEDVRDLDSVINRILQGDTVVVFNNIKKAISFDTKKVPQRTVQEPETESVLKGAKDGFVENIRTNTALVRKKVKSRFLRFDSFEVGIEGKTPVNIVYLDDVVDKEVLSKIRRRIKNIRANSLISPRTFEANICDNKYSIFPQFQYTERVDKFCSNLIDGKIGILIDGLPIGYIVPGVMAMFFQAPEDYSENYALASSIRVLRYFCAFLSILLPGFYIAITTYHPAMIPTKLLLSIIESKSGVPFAITFEVIGLLIAFELLLEASLRLPKSIGATISIIGGLIVGEAAVNAKLISPVVVVIIAITGIAGFVIPNQSLSNATRICRMLIVISASVAGLFGITFALIVILYYLCRLESFGVPYLVPFVSNEGREVFSDTMVRLPKDVDGGSNE